MEHRDWKEAEDTFKELRSEPANKNDTYACLAQGAIPLNSLSGKRKVSPADPSPKSPQIQLHGHTLCLSTSLLSQAKACSMSALIFILQSTGRNVKFLKCD